MPGSDLAVAMEMRDDNSGPHTVEEIHKIYAGLRQQFPNAKVHAANLTEIANAVEPYRGGLPVVTQEIGDTWIYGVPSDPLKVARYREVARLRDEWIAGRQIRSPAMRRISRFLRSFLLEVEHTWGTDTKTWLDFDHYTPRDLASMLTAAQVQSGAGQLGGEARRTCSMAIADAAGGPAHRGLGARCAASSRRRPTRRDMRPHAPRNAIDTTHFMVALDPTPAPSTACAPRPTGREWASAETSAGAVRLPDSFQGGLRPFLRGLPEEPRGLGPEGFRQAQYRALRRAEPHLASGAGRGLAPAGRERAPHRGAVGHRRRRGPGRRPRGVAAADVPRAVAARMPSRGWRVAFSWFGKASNRMPEALWLTFQPAAPDPTGWMLDKCGAWVSPFDVVTGGNRAMHAVAGGVRYQDTQGTLSIETMDAPVVALGARTPLCFTREEPDLSKGLHFSLFNNGWGTNYIQWFGEDMRFRFGISA